MTALIVGTVIALVALGFVLYPLFRESVVPVAIMALAGNEEREGAAHAIEALREVEFDRETGKLSESDYAALKARYTREALAVLRAAESAAVSDDELEAVILTYRARRAACPTCGPRPESDAIYCSTCGRYLADTCSRCGAPVAEPMSRFCSACGKTLAA